MKIGIDRIAFATSNQFVDMAELAHARHEDPNKYLIGIGQKEMAVIPPTQDIVTLAASAAKKVLGPEERDHLGMIMFATESAVDNSKSAAAPLIRLLDLDPHVRVAELKQACYTSSRAGCVSHCCRHCPVRFGYSRRTNSRGRCSRNDCPGKSPDFSP